MEKIFDAGMEVFSTCGFRGSALDQIAAGAGMSKVNLLYCPQGAGATSMRRCQLTKIGQKRTPGLP